MPKNLFIRILNRLKLLPLLNIRKTIIIDNTKVIIPLKGSIGISNLWLSELWMGLVIKKLRQLRSGYFIDIGANIGQTLIKVKAIDRQLPYIGFEPNTACVDYLNCLIEANQYPNTQVLPIGLSDQAEVLPLHMTKNRTDVFATLVGKDFREEGVYVEQTYVPVTKFDNLLDLITIDNIFLIKVDVEGGELEVLTGAMKTLARFRPFILCEVLPVHDATSKRGQLRLARQFKVQQILKELDYLIGRLDHNNGSITCLETIGIHSNMAYCDYLFFPSESYNHIASVCKIDSQAK